MGPELPHRPFCTNDALRYPLGPAARYAMC
jgi:hypothetical protein